MRVKCKFKVIILIVLATLVFACLCSCDTTLESDNLSDLKAMYTERLERDSQRNDNLNANALKWRSILCEQGKAEILEADSVDEVEAIYRATRDEISSIVDVFSGRPLSVTDIYLNQQVKSTTADYGYVVNIERSNGRYCIVAFQSADEGVSFKLFVNNVSIADKIPHSPQEVAFAVYEHNTGDYREIYFNSEQSYFGFVAIKDEKTLGYAVYGYSGECDFVVLSDVGNVLLTEQQQRTLIDGKFSGDNAEAELGVKAIAKPVYAERQSDCGVVRLAYGFDKSDDVTEFLSFPTVNGAVEVSSSDALIYDSVRANGTVLGSDSAVYVTNDVTGGFINLIFFRNGRIAGFAVIKYGFESSPKDEQGYFYERLSARIVKWVEFNYDDTVDNDSFIAIETIRKIMAAYK